MMASETRARRWKRLAHGATMVAMVAADDARAEPTATARETARALMQEGRDLRDAGDATGALPRFRAADDVMHVPTTALEVARTQAMLGLLIEARDTIAALRKMPVTPLDPAPFALARQRAEELDASVEPQIPSLTVRTLGETGARVTIDGVLQPTSMIGLAWRVDPGHHRIVIRSATGEHTSDLDIAAGESKQVDAERPAEAPHPSPAPPVAAEGSLHVASPPPASSSSNAMTVAGLGVAATGAIAGTIAGLVALSARGNLDRECPQQVCSPGGPSDDLDAGQRAAIVSDVCFVAAGVGAAVALIAIWLRHGHASAAPTATPVAVGPAAGPAAGLRFSF